MGRFRELRRGPDSDYGHQSSHEITDKNVLESPIDAETPTAA